MAQLYNYDFDDDFEDNAYYTLYASLGITAERAPDFIIHKPGIHNPKFITPNFITHRKVKPKFGGHTTSKPHFTC